MSKKIGIITIIDDNNYGNRLQNYATQETIKKLGMESFTLKNYVRCNEINSFFKVYLLLFLKKIQNLYFRLKTYRRYKKFKNFNKTISFYTKTITSINAKKIDKKFDYYICGSDQIWNLNFRRSSYIDMLEFTSYNKKVAFSPSFGVSDFKKNHREKITSALKNFKALSIREESGKKLICELTNRNDTEVLIDPTMLLTSEEWDKIVKAPSKLKSKKYILIYFLGGISKDREKEIIRVANENNCDIIDVLDKKSEFNSTGPSEFLYLIKNAFLICTDSFHSCVFSILYNKPFIVFDRIGSGKSMNSRIDTLLNKFNLNDRKYNDTITGKYLICDYNKAYNILASERKKSINFLKRSLDIIDD